MGVYDNPTLLQNPPGFRVNIPIDDNGVTKYPLICNYCCNVLDPVEEACVEVHCAVCGNRQSLVTVLRIFRDSQKEYGP